MRNFEFPEIHEANQSDMTKIMIDISMKRFSRQFQKAQYQLDSMVMTDMIPYMPMITGTFIKMTQARSAAIAGTGYVYAAAPPYGRFLYKGKVMVSPVTGSTYAAEGEKKVLVSQYGGMTNARENLEFAKTAHPLATAEWFEAAKERNLSKWKRLTKTMAGGG
jgi:hypothetical protein